MTAEEFQRIVDRLRETAMSSIYIPREDVALLVAEVKWLKRRLRRIEHAVSPITEALRQG
jgi:hypothetical protein